jgi:hypothetical protein
MEAARWNRPLLLSVPLGRHWRLIYRHVYAFRPCRQVEGVMVKCAACGYLGVRDMDNKMLVNPSAEQRRNGQPPSNSKGGAATQAEPICALGICDLESELTGPGSAPAATVMSKDRICSPSTKNIPALTPKEHIDMNVLERQQAFQQEWREKDQQWRETQAKDQRQWQKDQEKLQNERHRTDVRYRTIHFAIILVAAFGAVLLAALLARSRPQTEHHPANPPVIQESAVPTDSPVPAHNPN